MRYKYTQATTYYFESRISGEIFFDTSLSHPPFHIHSSNSYSFRCCEKRLDAVQIIKFFLTFLNVRTRIILYPAGPQNSIKASQQCVCVSVYIVEARCITLAVWEIHVKIMLSSTCHFSDRVASPLYGVFILNFFKATYIQEYKKVLRVRKVEVYS